MSSIYKDKEIGLRNLISEKLQRGKIELSIWKENLESNVNYTLNNELITDYFNQIKEITETLQICSKDIFPSLLNLP